MYKKRDIYYKELAHMVQKAGESKSVVWSRRADGTASGWGVSAGELTLAQEGQFFCSSQAFD